MEGFVTVHLLSLPVAVHAEASEHADELQREFALLELQQSDPDSSDVPPRLRRLIEQLEERFGAFTAGPAERLAAARAQGDEAVDLVYEVPPAAREAVVSLGELLDQADDFCRRGDLLLTLATPPRALAYRRWFLGEFLRQLDGEPPRPWPGD